MRVIRRGGFAATAKPGNAPLRAVKMSQLLTSSRAMSPAKSLLLSSLLALPPAAGAADVRFHGYAYDLESGEHLYTEVHQQNIEGERWLSGSITYLAPDGSLIGTKTLDFSQDPFIPVFRLELKTGGGYAEGIAALGKDSIDMFRKGYKASEPAEKTVARPPHTTADSGFHSLLRDRFPQLMDHKEVRFHFAVPGELDVFKFRARRIGDSTFEDKPAVRFLVEPDTLLRLLADPLEITYDPANRQLVEYRGISNLHDPATGDAYNVRIVYPSKPPAEAAKLPPAYR